MTTYLVFQKNGEGFNPIGEAEVSNPRQAIRVVLNNDNYVSTITNEGVFVAVPKRSWNPETVAPKTAFSFS